MELNNTELMSINGGGVTASYLNALARIYTTVLNVGQTLGSALRRAVNGKYCKV